MAHLIVQGLQDKVWALKRESDWQSPVLRAYLKESGEYLGAPEGGISGPEQASASPSAVR